MPATPGMNGVTEDYEDVNTINQYIGVAGNGNHILMIEDYGEFEAMEPESDFFDPVCAICDNGGDVVCCGGPCKRSFHATKDAGADSICPSLGLHENDIRAMEAFVCMNCRHKKHQCFVCGRLGSSDYWSKPEVFRCCNDRCNHFYHPRCVANLLCPGNQSEAADKERSIVAGELFSCPAHRCAACRGEENPDLRNYQFAVCRRCPKSYHRQCLPSEIAVADPHACDNSSGQRAWDGLLENQILMYCMNHEIDRRLGTPARNHPYPLVLLHDGSV